MFNSLSWTDYFLLIELNTFYSKMYQEKGSRPENLDFELFYPNQGVICQTLWTEPSRKYGSIFSKVLAVFFQVFVYVLISSKDNLFIYWDNLLLLSCISYQLMLSVLLTNVIPWTPIHNLTKNDLKVDMINFRCIIYARWIPWDQFQIFQFDCQLGVEHGIDHQLGSDNRTNWTFIMEEVLVRVGGCS